MATTYQAGEQTKQLILNESKILFYRNGYTGTTYSDISAAAKMNRALIPYHFKTKQSLGKAVIYEIINSAYNNIDEMLGTSDLSEDLNSALHIAVYYRLLDNSKYAALINDLINDNGSDIFNMDDEIISVKALGKNFRKLSDKQLNLICRNTIALKKELAQCILDTSYDYNADELTEFHIESAMIHAGYSKKTISELIDAALQLANLIDCKIEDGFHVSVSYI